MHEVIAEEWDQEAVDCFKLKHKWEAVLSSSFERADNEVLTEAAAPEIVGSTAIVPVLSGCQIIVSKCGESRAVLCRGTETSPLAVGQKPDREDELLRIKKQDGNVIYYNGARVLGVLAMSRAIGDRYLRPWIIPVLEITFTTRTDEDECLILASDGLWDFMTNNEFGEIEKVLLVGSSSNSHINLAPTLKKSSSRLNLTLHEFLPVSNKKTEACNQGNASSFHH
ncbi:protein phosphatase 2C family protein [Artemisia annua]|uniref:Protein phosphatase 2C family protein n=1 Tax=Artemisia annua TaxID=35608 RepID=A0A2U1PA74_ARTAN|nr:protein phosphatase 2C family protein [Artemisia annua]